MMQIQKNDAPTLRFPEFKEVWNSKMLGGMGHFTGGGTPDTSVKKYWKGSIPWVSSSDIVDGDIHNFNISKYITDDAINKSATKLVPENSVMFISRVGVGKLAINKNAICTSQDFTSFTPNKEKSLFVGYFFQAKKNILHRYSQGTSIKGVTTKYLKSIKIRYPEVDEQQKIASFLSSVDTKIEQLAKKKALLEQYKKGMMQKLFSQEIRFKNEQGSDFPDWAKKELADTLDYKQPTPYLVSSAEYDDSNTTPVLTAGKTFVLGYTNEKIGIFKKELPTIIFDDFTTAFKYVDFPFKAKSSAMKMLIPRNSDTNLQFVYAAMSQIRFPLGEHKRYWISEYQWVKIGYPCSSEQQKIADFLSAIDQKTNLVATKLNQVKTFKKGLLQQMFI